MTQGVLLFANNNKQIDYVKQAIYCAKKIKKHLGLPVALVTENVEYLYKTYPFYTKYIDYVISVDRTTTDQQRGFRDGVYTKKVLEWKNQSRSDCYDLTPFDETLVMDTDYIVCNSHLKNCFNSQDDFLIYKDFVDISPGRNMSSLRRVSDRSIDMWWATVFYFKKNDNMKFFFDLVKHVKENWNFYRLTYQIANRNFRNDFAFSIAIHILNGFENTNWPKPLPGKMYLSTDLDIVTNAKEETFTVLTDQKENGTYRAVKVSDSNLHIMNKFSLGRIIDEEFADE